MQPGSDLWWDVIRSSPFNEAEVMLRDYKTGLLRENFGKPEYSEAGFEIQRVNAELHRLSQVMQRCTLRKAVRNICGDEVYMQIMEEVARLECMEAAA